MKGKKLVIDYRPTAVSKFSDEKDTSKYRAVGSSENLGVPVVIRCKGDELWGACPVLRWPGPLVKF